MRRSEVGRCRAARCTPAQEVHQWAVARSQPQRPRVEPTLGRPGVRSSSPLWIVCLLHRCRPGPVPRRVRDARVAHWARTRRARVPDAPPAPADEYAMLRRHRVDLAPTSNAGPVAGLHRQRKPSGECRRAPETGRPRRLSTAQLPRRTPALPAHAHERASTKAGRCSRAPRLNTRRSRRVSSGRRACVLWTLVRTRRKLCRLVHVVERISSYAVMTYTTAFTPSRSASDSRIELAGRYIGSRNPRCDQGWAAKKGRRSRHSARVLTPVVGCEHAHSGSNSYCGVHLPGRNVEQDYGRERVAQAAEERGCRDLALDGPIAAVFHSRRPCRRSRLTRKARAPRRTWSGARRRPRSRGSTRSPERQHGRPLARRCTAW
jgi:hypothetical protein